MKKVFVITMVSFLMFAFNQTAEASNFGAFAKGFNEAARKKRVKNAEQETLSPNYLRAQCEELGITQGEQLQNCMLKMYELNQQKNLNSQTAECKFDHYDSSYTCETSD